MDRGHKQFDIIGQLAALRRYARSLVRNPDDAEDLVHDALVRAYEKRRSFRTGGNLKGWLFSILHNTHADRYRAGASRTRREEQALEDLDPVLSGGQEEAVRLADVRRAFMALPEDQREALHLVAVEDLSYQQAADALGIPLGTLMSRISRARARLRAMDSDAGSETGRGPGHLRLVGGSDD